MGRLDQKVAVVTGGNSGIGLATAKQFVNEGAHVFITGRREAELAAAVKEIGKNVTAVQGDVTSLAESTGSTRKSSARKARSTSSSRMQVMPASPRSTR
jgi:NAD(P)-dependent dehydrogenase (short-subunit alcohol dehydrogenase family)